MPHIHTQPGHVDMTVAAYIVLLTTDEPRLLLHVHKKFGILMPAGGHVELDETPWAAIAHEIAEETGYDLSELSVLQPAIRMSRQTGSVIHPQPLLMNTHAIGDDHYHSDTVYVLTATHKPSRLPNDDESQALSWYTRAETAALSSDKIWEDVQANALAIFDTFLSAWEPIPAQSFSVSKKQ